MGMKTVNTKRFDIELRDQMIEQTYALLKRTAQKEVSEDDCNRWTILWTMLNAGREDLHAMTSAIVAIDLEGRRRRMGRKVEA